MDVCADDGAPTIQILNNDEHEKGFVSNFIRNFSLKYFLLERSKMQIKWKKNMFF